MTTIATTLRASLIGCALTLAGCSELEIENKPPVARVKVFVDGAETDPTKPIMWAGVPLAITLDGAGSSDEDGSIASFFWHDTDAPAYERFAGNGLVDSGALPPYAGDPAPGPVVQLSLGEGTYKYSLWVTDDEKYTSAPATVTLRICTTPCM